MNKKQFDAYAKFYDLLYKDKDYPKEAAYIHEQIRKHNPADSSSMSVLDLACGTGKHLMELSSLGYTDLSGSDISAAMINVAQQKASGNKNKIRYYNFSFQDTNAIQQEFDVIISMFSAINYLTSFSDQLKSFKNIHGLLKGGGLFLFDYWNGNAVVRDYSPIKVLRKKSEDEEIMRISTTEINTVTQAVSVKFSCLYFENGKMLDEFEEIHSLHYYHFSEMNNLLEIAGFEVLHVSPFMSADKPIQPHDWNVSIVARKKI